MSNPSDQIYDALLAAGHSPSAARDIMVQFTAQTVAKMPSKGALRTQRWRERKASQTVTGDAQQPSVTERHKASQNVTGDAIGPIYKEDSIGTETVFSEVRKEKKVSKNIGPSNRKTRLDVTAQPSPEDIKFAETKGVDWLVEWPNFVTHHGAAGTLMANWHLAWCKWVNNHLKWGKSRSQKHNQPSFYELSVQLNEQANRYDDAARNRENPFLIGGPVSAGEIFSDADDGSPPKH